MQQPFGLLERDNLDGLLSFTQSVVTNVVIQINSEK